MASTELRINVVYCLISTLLVTGEYTGCIMYAVFYRGTQPTCYILSLNSLVLA